MSDIKNDRKNCNTEEKSIAGVPKERWYRVEVKEHYFKADEEVAIKEGIDWINQQTPIYCDEKIINFKSYKKAPLFDVNEKKWIEEPFVFLRTKAPKGWYCVTKSVCFYQPGNTKEPIDTWKACYQLYYHKFNKKFNK